MYKQITAENCDLYTLLNYHKVEVVFYDDENLLLYYPEIKTVFCSCKDDYAQHLFTLASSLPLLQVCSHNKVFISFFSNYSLKFISRNALYKGENIKLPNIELSIIQATQAHCDEIYKFYNHYADYDYLQSRIKQGNILLAYKNEELAGFIGTHTEGSIGMLFVKDKFRRQKIGTYLEVSMINRMIDKSLPVFAQITPDNLQSVGQHKGLGFTISQQDIFWIML